MTKQVVPLEVVGGKNVEAALFESGCLSEMSTDGLAEATDRLVISQLVCLEEVEQVASLLDKVET